MTLSKEFTQADHEARSTDAYALSKYRITLTWLGEKLKPGAVLFNIGCGGGFLHTLLPTTTLRVVACEPDPAAFALADRSNPAPDSISIYNEGIFDFASRIRDQADIVIMHDVLEHIEDEAETVNTLARLAGPRSTLIVSVPALPWLFGHHDIQLGHYRRYTKNSLRRALAGRFEIRRLRYFGFSFIPIVLWFSVFRKKPYPLGQARPTMSGSIFDLLCRLEELVPLPLGTSVICEVQPKVGDGDAQ